MKISTFTRHIGVGMLAFCATFVQASMVNAARADEVRSSQSIRSNDLDLSKSTDVATLYQRIHKAAEAVCGTGVVTGSRLAGSANLRCISDAVDSTVMKINKTPLTSYHRQTTTHAG